MRSTATLALTAVACLAMASISRAQVPTSVGHVASDELPLWVYYNAEGQIELAQQVLAAAEQAWQEQVEGMGFAAPTTVDDDGEIIQGQRIYLVSDDRIGGHAVQLADNPATPQTDCATICLVNDALPNWYYPELVTHEFNHTLQMAVDCTESYFAYEQITVAVTTTLIPDDTTLPWALPDFQARPERALYNPDWNSYYHYGAALFSLFLDQRYGDGDGVLLAQLWAATAQPGEVRLDGVNLPSSSTPNEPDLLDAMIAVLATRGVEFDDAFTEFATARYFIGALDDGGHIAGANRWPGSEPRIDARYNLDQLPLIDAAPLLSPEPLGVGFTVVDTLGADADQVLRVGFNGGEGVAWRARLLLVGRDGTQELDINLDAEQRGQAQIADLDHLSRVVLVAVNLGDSWRDPDDLRVVATDYTFSAELLECPAVVLDRADPGLLEPGGQTTVSLRGDGFASDQEIAVAISGDDVEVVEVVRVSSNELEVTFAVDDSADVGGRQLEVRLECGSEGSADDLVEVGGVVGMGCSTLTGAPPPLLLFGLLVLAKRRRKV